MSTTIHRHLAPLFVLLVFIAALPVLAAQAPSPDGLGEGPGAANTVCPVTPEETVDPSFSAEYEGQTVYFCCRRCQLRFQQDPEAYAESLALVMPVAAEPSGNQPASRGHDHNHAGQTAGTERNTIDEHDDGPDDAAHDHATDHGLSAVARLGRLHVVSIHFPIAFLILAGFVELVGVVRHRWQNHSTVRLLIAMGALSALVATTLGLLHGSADDYSGTLSWVFWWHRALGISVSLLAIVAWIAVERRAKKPGGRFATVTLLVTAALVGVAGHFGGSLVYGWEYLLP